MRIGCLQFAPQVGDIDNNLNRAVRISLHSVATFYLQSLPSGPLCWIFLGSSGMPRCVVRNVTEKC